MPECGICLSELLKDDARTVLKCGHVFHEECGTRCEKTAKKKFLESSTGEWLACPQCKLTVPDVLRAESATEWGWGASPSEDTSRCAASSVSNASERLTVSPDSAEGSKAAEGEGSNIEDSKAGDPKLVLSDREDAEDANVGNAEASTDQGSKVEDPKAGHSKAEDAKQNT